MTIKHWDDRELAKVSADLDAELEQLFDEMETVLTSPGEEEAKPQLEFLPDDEEEKYPPKARRLRPESDHQSSPTSDELQSEDFEALTAAISPAEEKLETQAQPRGRKTLISPRAAVSVEHELPEAEVLPDDHDEDIQPSQPETIADLSPDEFSRLMERAVARGVLAALKKWQKPLR